MTRPHAAAADGRRLRIFSAVLAVLWAAMFVWALADLRRGAPDAYPRQHASGALLSGGSLLLALGALAPGRRLRWALLAGSAAAFLANLAGGLLR